MSDMSRVGYRLVIIAAVKLKARQAGHHIWLREEWNNEEA